MGRVGTRYPTTLLSWGVGIVSLLLFHSWGIDGQQLSVPDSLGVFVRRRMPGLMVVAGVVAMLPLGPDYYLGIGNELGMLRAVLAVLVVGVAVGLVCVSWWLLVALLWPLRLLRRGFTQRYCTTTQPHISELTIGKQKIRRRWSATKHSYLDGPRAGAHISVCAVAGSLPWMLGHTALQLQCELSSQVVPGFCPNAGQYAHIRTGTG